MIRLYTILVNSDNSLTKTVVERIMQGSSMVDKLHFLVDQTYKGHDMTTFKLVMEYVLPISRKYIVEEMTPSTELYKGKVEYILPFDTKLTVESGDIELKLTFTKLEMDENGNFIERVRKIDSTYIKVLPVARWADYISDSNLDSIAQMMLSAQALAEQNLATAEYLSMNKADNIKYDREVNELWLESNGERIGDVVTELPNNDCGCEDGVPVVVFNDETGPENTEVDNVIEF